MAVENYLKNYISKNIKTFQENKGLPLKESTCIHIDI